FIVYGIRLNMETLAPGLWIDANVIDCRGAILNHEERFRDAESKARHFFPTGCITKSMFDGTLTSHNDKWESFSNQVKAHFKGNEGGLALEGIDLKKMFARNLKLYGHNRHALVARLKHKIPKLKWSTKGNFHDCGIFTMLHMESYNGGTAANWDCGLPKMLDLATEFDKVDPYQRMSIIVEAVKKREERERIYTIKGTDIAKISRKRSKPDKHGHGNGIECAKAGRMLSKNLTSQEAPIGPLTHGCYVGNPCAPQSNPTIEREHPMIEGMKGQYLWEHLSTFKA
ncbi:ulp1 protease family, C-terminal catalytic domain-containing protein, partial [Tanacetum coccineum]